MVIEAHDGAPKSSRRKRSANRPQCFDEARIDAAMHDSMDLPMTIRYDQLAANARGCSFGDLEPEQAIEAGNMPIDGSREIVTVHVSTAAAYGNHA